MSDNLIVREIYTSIDGEINCAGQGMPTTFIRLGGCNLDCPYCDTDHSADRSKEMSIEHICSQVNTRKVTITGGEPLLQNIYSLVFHLFDRGHFTSIETNGTVEIDPVFKDVACFVVDYKLHDPESFVRHNLALLDFADYLKIPIANKEDFVQAVNFLNSSVHYGEQSFHLAFSPIHKELDPVTLFGWMMEAGLDTVVLNIQLHKYINFK